VVLFIAALLLGTCVWVVSSVGLDRARDRTCKRSDIIRVRVGGTPYAIPAFMQPTFSPADKKSAIRTPWKKGRRSYCPNPGGPAVQEAIILTEPARNLARQGKPELFDALRPVRVMNISTRPRRFSRPYLDGEASGPILFGRPTVYHCFEGYYGPGQTCRYYGWTPEGAGVFIQMYPRANGHDTARAVTATEKIIHEFRRDREQGLSAYTQVK